MPTDELILFFDGVCGLCDRLVDFVIAHDHARKFHFSPLQSDFARARLAENSPANDKALFSAFVWDQGELLRKSDAILRVAAHLGGAWKLAGAIAGLVPRPLRDWVYDLIAVRRYRWFGKRETCRIPTAAERARFRL